MSKMLAVLPRGEAIRNFVYTNILDRVADSSDLRVASVIPNAEIENLLHDRYGDIVPMDGWTDRRPIGLMRDVLDMAHGRWLWSEAAQERWRLHDLMADTPSARAKREVKKVMASLLAHQRVLTFMTSLYERSAGRWPPSTTPHEVIQQVQPDLVFNASHVHSRNALGLLTAAKARKVPTATFLFSWDNLTSQGRIIPNYDWYLAWSEQIREDLLRLYPSIPPHSVFVTGTPQFDSHFDESLAWSRPRYCQEIGVDPDRPIVLYTTGMPNHMPGETTLVEDLADRLALMPSRPQLVVRVYAKDRTGRFDEMKARRADIVFPPVAWELNWLTPLPEDTALWSNMVRHADVGVNVASTVSLELCMFDRPVANIAYNPPEVPTSELEYARFYSFDHYKPVAQSGAIAVATSPDELIDAISDGLSKPAARSGQRKALLKDLFGDHLDGRASERIAAKLVELTNG